MSAYNRRTRNLLLSCLHKVEIQEPAPSIGDEQYCMKCSTWRHVKQYVANYRIYCMTRCTYGRAFTTEEMALKYANRHVQSHPKHRVEIKLDGQKIREVTNVENDLFATHSEMAALSRNAQQLLRDAFGAEVVNPSEM